MSVIKIYIDTGGRIKGNKQHKIMVMYMLLNTWVRKNYLEKVLVKIPMHL